MHLPFSATGSTAAGYKVKRTEIWDSGSHIGCDFDLIVSKVSLSSFGALSQNAR